MPTEIAVALVSGGFAVVVALIGKLMRQNKTDHDLVLHYLLRINRKLDKHLEDPDAHT